MPIYNKNNISYLLNRFYYFIFFITYCKNKDFDCKTYLIYLIKYSIIVITTILIVKTDS
jgi:hypothetical protein